MDNFDNFDKEVDPAAEFLSREQNELAGLEDEVKPAAQFIPQVNGGKIQTKGRFTNLSAMACFSINSINLCVMYIYFFKMF